MRREKTLVGGSEGSCGNVVKSEREESEGNEHNGLNGPDLGIWISTAEIVISGGDKNRTEPSIPSKK